MAQHLSNFLDELEVLIERFEEGVADAAVRLTHIAKKRSGVSLAAAFGDDDRAAVSFKELDEEDRRLRAKLSSLNKAICKARELRDQAAARQKQTNGYEPESTAEFWQREALEAGDDAEAAMSVLRSALARRRHAGQQLHRAGLMTESGAEGLFHRDAIGRALASAGLLEYLPQFGDHFTPLSLVENDRLSLRTNASECTPSLPKTDPEELTVQLAAGDVERFREARTLDPALSGAEFLKTARTAKEFA